MTRTHWLSGYQASVTYFKIKLLIEHAMEVFWRWSMCTAEDLHCPGSRLQVGICSTKKNQLFQIGVVVRVYEE